MDSTNWFKQKSDEPLFSELLWSRPENKAHAGKLLIIGGNAHGFAAPAEAYQESLKAGIGVSRVILPSALQKTVGKIFVAGEYAPSTPSGSFNKQALAEILDLADWADGVMLAGDLGRNSETAVLLENIMQKFSGPLTITQDAADYLAASSSSISRPETLLVLSFSQLQKLGISAKFTKAFTFDIGLLNLVDNLHELTSKYPAAIVVKHLENIIVAANGQVSSTKLETDLPIWRVRTAAQASVWWLQNPNKKFEALTTAIYEINQNKKPS